MLGNYCTVLLVGVGSRDGDLLGSLLGGRAGEGDGQDPVGHRRFDLLGLQRKASVGGSMRGNGETNLDALGKRDRTREPAKPALPDRVALLVPVRRDGGLARDAEDVVLDVDLDVLLRQAGELERGCHEVLLLVLVQVQSATEPVSTRC